MENPRGSVPLRSGGGIQVEPMNNQEKKAAHLTRARGPHHELARLSARRSSTRNRQFLQYLDRRQIRYRGGFIAVHPASSIAWNETRKSADEAPPLSELTAYQSHGLL